LNQQKYYYVNLKTGVTQWEKPSSEQPQATTTVTVTATATDLPLGWQQYFDAGQQAYYYVESSTGKSQWEKPVPQLAQGSRWTTRRMARVF
jgi:outer membrane protein assembly factor BamB